MAIIKLLILNIILGISLIGYAKPIKNVSNPNEILGSNFDNPYNLVDENLIPYRFHLNNYFFVLDANRLVDVQQFFGGKIRKFNNANSNDGMLCYQDKKKGISYLFSTGLLTTGKFNVLTISTIDNDKECDISKEPISLSFAFSFDKRYLDLDSKDLLYNNKEYHQKYDKRFFPTVGNTLDDIKTYFNNKNIKLDNNNTITFATAQFFYDDHDKNNVFERRFFVSYLLKDNKVIALSVRKLDWQMNWGHYFVE